MIGAALGLFAHTIYEYNHQGVVCCKTQTGFDSAYDMKVQREHEPDDVLGNGQTDQFKPKVPEELSALPDGSKNAAVCRELGGVPYWVYTPEGEEYLTCHAGNVAGKTHGP
jgi:hypothetical protein